MSPGRRVLLCVLGRWKGLGGCLGRLRAGVHRIDSRCVGQRALWLMLGRPWLTPAGYISLWPGCCLIMARHRDSEREHSCWEEGREKSKRKKKIREEKKRSQEDGGAKLKRKKEKKKKKKKERHEKTRKLRAYAKKAKELKANQSPPPLIDIASSSESEEVQLVYDSRLECVKGGMKLALDRKVVATAPTRVVPWPLHRAFNTIASAGCTSGTVSASCTNSTPSASCTSGTVSISCTNSTPSASCTNSTPSASCSNNIRLPSCASDTDFDGCTNTTASGSCSDDVAFAGSSLIENPQVLDCSVKVLSPEETGAKGEQSRWETVTMATADEVSGGKGQLRKPVLTFDVLSYNVLAQDILEQHPHLYTQNKTEFLQWDSRSQLLMEEFKAFNADILCLQEVQESHLKSFYCKLNSHGYSGLYKQRTGNKVDGVAIYYKNSKFRLIDYATVEYYQPGVSILNRDNVAIVAKFAPVDQPTERLVVATTHLLFNPNRHDVKLAQVQVLLAEVERFAFHQLDPGTGYCTYWPVILTGDMNFEPSSGPYKLLTDGSFRFEGLGNKRLTPGFGQPLRNYLLPPSLGITDTCQHWNLLLHRNVPVPLMCERLEREPEDHLAELALIQLYNSDHKKLPVPVDQILNSYLSEYTSTGELPNVGFATGQLSHHLNLSSVYSCGSDEKELVSTFQDEWLLVDYIFYSKSLLPSDLQLLARYRLLTVEEARSAGPIPNAGTPSDHYPLIAKFALHFKGL